jgi:hypothetical protein
LSQDDYVYDKFYEAILIYDEKCLSLIFSQKRHKIAHYYKTMMIFCDNNTSFLKNLACYLCNTSFTATLFLLVTFFMVSNLVVIKLTIVIIANGIPPHLLMISFATDLRLMGHESSEPKVLL